MTTLMTPGKESARETLHYFFTSRGYSCGLIPVSALDLTIPLGTTHFYRGHFEVDDLLSKCNDIAQEFGKKPLKADKYESEMLGRCITTSCTVGDLTAYGHDVLIKRDLDTPHKALMQGHENGHVIYQIDRNILYQRYNLPDNLISHIQDEEDFALLCGFLALKLKGHDLEQVHNFGSSNPGLISQADRMLRLAREYI